MNVYFVDVNIPCECALRSKCSWERCWTSASQFELFFDIQYLYLFFTSVSHLEQPAVHAVDPVDSRLGRGGRAERSRGGVFYRTVVYFSPTFATLVCFGVNQCLFSEGFF